MNACDLRKSSMANDGQRAPRGIGRCRRGAGIRIASLLIGLASTSCFTGFVSGQDKLDAKGVAQLALDALFTREAQWKTGMMDVRVEQTGANVMAADLSLVWKESHARLDIRYHSSTTLSLDGTMEQEERQPHVLLITPKEEWSYFPSLTEAFGNLTDKPRGISWDIEIRPLQIWSTFPFVETFRLSKMLKDAVQNSDILEVTSLDDGLLRLTKKSLVFFIDPASDGDIVRLEHNMGASGPIGEHKADPMMLIATYEWDRDPHGVPYCRKFRVERFEPGHPDKAFLTRRVDVLQYSSRVPKTAETLDIKSLDIPVGTKMNLTGAGRSRSWRHGVPGSESQDVLQIDLERMIEETKKSGFARPQAK